MNAMWATIYQIHDSYKARIYFYTESSLYIEQNSSLEASAAIQLFSFPKDVEKEQKNA